MAMGRHRDVIGVGKHDLFGQITMLATHMLEFALSETYSYNCVI